MADSENQGPLPEDPREVPGLATAHPHQEA